MLAFLVRRVALIAVVLLAMTFVTFLMAEVIPGDPARSAAGLNASSEAIAAARERLGLDKPLLSQYRDYLSRLLHGDLGTSAFTHRPITSNLRDVLPPSVELVLAAMLINVMVAIPLGVLAAVHRGGVTDGASRLTVMIAAGIPVFWLGLMLQLVLAANRGWFPLTGTISPDVDAGQRITGMPLFDSLIQGKWAAAQSAFMHLVLPAITLAAAFVAVVTRTVRSSMIGVLDRDYVVLARAKGLSERRVVIRHALRNALLPCITIIGMQFGWMLGSTVLVENIYGRTGIGSYAVTAVLQSDLFAVVGVVLVIGVIFVLANFAVDLTYMWLNPRLRVGHGR
jgi:peptide/nickel transport system permease protein